MTRTTRKIWLALALLWLGAGCGRDPGWEPPNLSATTFESDVYPVLIRDCAFHACHGAESRFFRVWGSGRVRLNPITSAFDPTTKDEVLASYERAVSMVDPKNPTKSLLLRKPLAVAAGGAGHEGMDKFGRNVYRTVDDLGYLAISRWVFSISSQP